MGSKLSCIHRGSLSRQVHLPASPAPARVIAADGLLKELPVSSSSSVSDVLGPSGGDAASSFFLCNSDALYFNERPPAVGPGEVLRPGQIYFVLPASMLERPLSIVDVAALAVRATTALSSSSKQRRHGWRRARGGGKKKPVHVMPVHEEMEDGGEGEVGVFFNEKLNQQTMGELGMLLSPAKKDQKLGAAAATSRLKRALSIIQEDAE